MTRLVHIVPTVPPAFNGLSDYCYKLWQHWPAPRPHWHVLALEVPPGARAAWPEAQITPFAPNRRALLEALEQTDSRRIALHYVGYAYHTKGAPLWLPGVLREYKKRRGAQVCVMFHELYAGGTPRQSAFWLQPLTKRIVAQLAELSDSWIVSCEAAAIKLVGEVGADATRGHIVPIGSAIEPVAPTDWERPWPLERGQKLRLAIFGLPANRASALRGHQQLLRALIEADWLEEIALIGKAGDAAETQTLAALRDQIAPDFAGWNPYPDGTPAEISLVLARCHLALTHYPPDLLTKSSVYPAFCLHGLLTICAHRRLLPAPLQGAAPLGQGFEAPHLPADDANATATLRALGDSEAVARLRAATREVARNQLSWQSIADAWARATALGQ